MGKINRRFAYIKEYRDYTVVGVWRLRPYQ